ncbi:MAG: hypothetical protein KAG89_22520 [Fulvimarina manganoxydans]|uniref:hypothetical protein n=1 Tax=Fulvimarina manganoxydans TaxID=937218 RepID=UPI0023526F6D|nr:hypothetical protein [Fulvimarina manganoxydans]MCK5934919.1 hypothetical protein [Fulvimarina manganoxydans]
MSETVSEDLAMGVHTRRSKVARQPLVIDGSARRLDAPVRPASERRTLAREEMDARANFGRRTATEEAEIFFGAAAKRSPRKTAPAPEPVPPRIAPFKLAMIAGAVFAGLFLLPSLFAFAGRPNAAVLDTVTTGSLAASPLAIENVEATFVERSGAPVLTLSGRIANTADHDMLVPLLEIVLQDDGGGRVLRGVEVTTSRLKPGETVGFASSVLVPPEAGDRLALRFRSLEPSQ